MSSPPVPKLIEIPLKMSKVNPDYTSHLSKAVTSAGGDPAEYSAACSKLIELRKHAAAPACTASGVTKLQEYLGQLKLAQAKFNFSTGEAWNGVDEMPMNIKFLWTDVFKPDAFFAKVESEQSNVHFEWASVAFQLAAVQSAIAAGANLKEDAAVKDAVNACKAAISILSGLQDYMAANFKSSPSPDLDKGLLQFLVALMTGQGLECILAKVYRDCREGKGVALAAMLASQAAKDFGEALTLLKPYPVLAKRYGAEVAAKEAYYKGEAEFWQSEADIAEYKAGLQVGRLRKALALVESAAGALPWLKDRAPVINAKYEAANKENRIITLEPVIAEADLPEIRRGPHVITSRLPPGLPDFTVGLCDPPLFGALLSRDMQKSADKFKEELDDAAKKLKDTLASARTRCSTSLNSWNLPGALDVADNPDDVPATVMEASNQVQQHGGIRHIVSTVEAVLGRRRELKAIVDQAITMLDDEEKEDDQLATQYGDKWLLKPSVDLNKSTRAEAEKVLKVLADAAGSAGGDATISGKLENYRAGIAVLSGTPADIADSLPSVVERVSSGSARATGALRSHLRDIDSLKAELDRLEDSITNALGEIDVLGKLAHPDFSPASVIAEQVQVFVDAHEPAVEAVCSKLTTALNETEIANTAYVSSRAGNVNQAREGAVSALVAAADGYAELLSNCNEAETFYSKIEGVAKQLNKKVADFCESRRTEKKSAMSAISAAALRQPTVDAAGGDIFSAPQPYTGASGPYGSGGGAPGPYGSGGGAPGPYGSGGGAAGPYGGGGGGGGGGPGVPPYGMGGAAPHGANPYAASPYQPYGGNTGPYGAAGVPPAGGGYVPVDVPHAPPPATQAPPMYGGVQGGYGGYGGYSGSGAQPAGVLGSRGYGDPVQSGVSQLQEMFPTIPRHTLEDVLQRQGGNVQRAINECLSL